MRSNRGGAPLWQTAMICLGEAARNVATGTTRAALGALGLLIIVLGVVATDALAAAQVFTQQRAVADGGGATHIVAADGAISPQRCLALSGLRGVVGVMALREADARLPVLAMPHTAPATYEVAGDVEAVLGGVRTSRMGIWLAEGLSARLGAGPIPLADGSQAQVLGTFPYPDDGRSSRLATVTLLPVTADGAFDACWLKVWPHEPASVALLDSALEPGVENAERSVLNPTFGEPHSTADLLQARPTRPLLLVGLVATGGLGFALVWMRRVELSLALHLGVRPPQQRWQVLVETSAWALPAAALGAAVAGAVSAPGASPAEAAWLAREVAILTAALTALALAGALSATLLIREHKLFAWTKDR